VSLPITLGAPGIYWLPEEPIRALTGERMDVCAFVGVTPRGPARLPVFDAKWAPRPCQAGLTVIQSLAVPVESWDHYKRLYGSFEGPGRLPYAVASFFENGGRRAYIVRIVHEYRLPGGGLAVEANQAGIARASFKGLSAGSRGVWLQARNEGQWGNRLRATLSFATRPLSLAAEHFYPTQIRYPVGLNLPAGTLLRITLAGGTRVLRRLSGVREEWQPDQPVKQRWATLEVPLPGSAESVELVEGVLDVDDGERRHEHHERIGLSSDHPRWLAAVVADESALVYPALDPTRLPADPLASWLDADLDVAAALDPYGTAAFGAYARNHPPDQSPTPVEDRYEHITFDDFFDDGWVLGDECPGRGIAAITDVSDVSLLAVPDLYSPEPLTKRSNVIDLGGFAGPEFAACVEPTEPPEQGMRVDDLAGLSLNPATELDDIVALQRRVVDFADQLKSFIVLLDVPPRLSQRRVLRWRSAFDSAYAAAYHPWLQVARNDDGRENLILVNPAAVAAGIIAQREIEHGVPHGPANVIAAGVVKTVDRISSARHDELHPLGINVFLPERDGVRLTAARTLSSDPLWRQLSVRRLITLLCRVLERQMQWAVFEPNNDTLRADVRHLVEAYLRQLFVAKAFKGAREEDAFFVHCDDSLNPPAIVDQGRLIAHVGVAPAEPLEFVVLQIARDGDGTLRVEA
jgi:hypothetical protein